MGQQGVSTGYVQLTASGQHAQPDLGGKAGIKANATLPSGPVPHAVGMHRPEPVWRQSSYCGSHHNCVEIAWRQGAADIAILVRDSKFPGREPLVFTPGEWAGFLARVKAGEFDVLATPWSPEPAPWSAEERRIAEALGIHTLVMTPADHAENDHAESADNW